MEPELRFQIPNVEVSVPRADNVSIRWVQFMIWNLQTSGVVIPFEEFLYRRIPAVVHSFLEAA